MNINSLASTLHEIRTPIQTVLGTAELLKETSLDSEQQEYVRQIAFSADVFYTLVSDILDYKKIKNGKLKLENIPFNIQNIAEQSLDLVSIEAYNKGLELATEISVDTPEMIYGDPVRMLQILLYMVKNAVKFTNKGHVVIKISPDYQHSGFLLFKVSDTGIGIPKKKKMITWPVTGIGLQTLYIDAPWLVTGIKSSTSSDVPWRDTGIESGASKGDE